MAGATAQQHRESHQSRPRLWAIARQDWRSAGPTPPVDGAERGTNAPGRRRGWGEILVAVKTLAAGLTIALVLAAAGCSQPEPPEPGRTLAGEPLTECRLSGAPALCGTYAVPEDRANPDRTIDLNVVVVPASGADPAPDPVFFLAGGPGGAATEDFGWTLQTFATLQTDRDFVFVDQRGTGGSNRLAIEHFPDLSQLSEAEADEALAEWTQDALATLDGDPRFYTTSVAMDDLDDVRQALGYDLINLHGVSYGATAAQYYLRQHGERVRAVVLDGGTLLDVPIFERIAATSQDALDIVFDRCRAEPACSQAYPDLESEFAAVQGQLELEPVTLSATDPTTGEPIRVDALGFADGVHGALTRADLTAELPRLIHAAYVGDWDLVGQVVTAANAGQANDDQLVMSPVIRCSEAWARFDPDRTAAASGDSYLAAAQVAGARNWQRICRSFPRGVTPPDDDAPVVSDVPVLLIVGGADPQDPLANVAGAATQLPNSRVVVAPGQGHAVAHLGCLPALVAAFFQAGTADGLDTSCAADATPSPFRTG